MTLLSRKTDYALLILSYLQNHPEGGCARTIAGHFGLSNGFIANILKELCQKNFLASSRGVKGGYTLARPAEEITLGALLESMEDGFRLTQCTGNHADGPDAEAAHGEACVLSSTCPVRTPINAVHRRILEVLGTITLAEILQPGRLVELTQPTFLNLPVREPIASGT